MKTEASFIIHLNKTSNLCKNLKSLFFKNIKRTEYFVNTFIVADHIENGKNLFINMTKPNGNIVLYFSRANDYKMFCCDSTENLKKRHYAKNSLGCFMIQRPYITIHLVLLNSVSKIKEENND